MENVFSRIKEDTNGLGMYGVTQGARLKDGKMSYKFKIDNRGYRDLEEYRGSMIRAVDLTDRAQTLFLTDDRCGVCHKYHFDMRICGGCGNFSVCSLECELNSQHAMQCGMFKLSKEIFMSTHALCRSLGIEVLELLNFDILL